LLSALLLAFDRIMWKHGQSLFKALEVVGADQDCRRSSVARLDHSVIGRAGAFPP